MVMSKMNLDGLRQYKNKVMTLDNQKDVVINVFLIVLEKSSFFLKRIHNQRQHGLL